jgi:hypothetical protein
MSKVKATYSGFVSHDGIPVLLSAGEEYDTEHPLVGARSDLFSTPEKLQQQPQAQAQPKAAAASKAEETPKRGPGRPPKATAKKDDGG